MAEKRKELPSAVQDAKGLPQVGSPENSIIIGETLVEIKPTKLRYQRNRTAAFYKILELYPLVDVLAMEAGIALMGVPIRAERHLLSLLVGEMEACAMDFRMTWDIAPAGHRSRSDDRTQVEAEARLIDNGRAGIEDAVPSAEAYIVV